MALSIEELDLQGAEYLPAREVMSSIAGLGGGKGGSHDPSCTVVGGNYGNVYDGGVANGLTVGVGTGPILNDVANGLDVL